MADPILTLDGLGRQFGSSWAVRELSFSVPSREIFGLLGPNGAGKTTTLRMLIGLLRPSQGNATIGGFDVVRDDLQVRRIVGYMPETPALVDAMNLGTFLTFVGQTHGLSRQKILEAGAALSERLGLQDLGRDPLGILSFGTRKKVMLAALLLPEPRLLLLDEPTAGLDPGSAASVHQLLREAAARGAAVVLSTHLLDAAERICDRLAVIRQGSLVALGTLDEVRQGRSEMDLTDLFLELTNPAEPVEA